jgi:hypothetical protein
LKGNSIFTFWDELYYTSLSIRPNLHDQTSFQTRKLELTSSLLQHRPPMLTIKSQLTASGTPPHPYLPRIFLAFAHKSLGND